MFFVYAISKGGAHCQRQVAFLTFYGVRGHFRVTRGPPFVNLGPLDILLNPPPPPMTMYQKRVHGVTSPYSKELPCKFWCQQRVTM